MSREPRPFHARTAKKGNGMVPINRTPFGVAWIPWKIRPPVPSTTVIVKGTFELRPGTAAVPASTQEPLSGDDPPPDDPSKPLRYPSDFAPLKLRADWLVSGRAFAPGGKLAPAVGASVRVGRATKSVTILGDRVWKGAGASDPKPFLHMSLGYDRAFGGLGYSENPLGMGFADLRVPNIVAPHQLSPEPGDKTPPAGFGPIPLTWPPRKSKTGTYDTSWLKERWPWFPEDFDWSFFNVAPPDQQLEGYLAGDESLVFENLHPTRARYESGLPGIRIRCFHAEGASPWLRSREIPMNLDTLWVEVETEKAILVWRGLLDLAEPTPNDRLLIVSELLCEARRPQADYENLLRNSVDREPEGTEPIPRTEVTEPEPPSRAACLERLREGWIPAGLDLSGVDLSECDLSGIDFRGTVLTNAKLRKARMEKTDLTGAGLSGADLTDADLRQAKLENADLTGARLVGARLEEADLTGADFSGARLRKASLMRVRAPGAVGTGADLTGANLRGGRLEETDLSGARLHEADLSECDLRRASLEGAWGHRLQAAGANLTDLRAAKARLGEANFRGAKASGSVWQEAELYGADFREADLSEAEFEGAFLAEARLSQAILKRARLARAFLRRAQLLRANLLYATLSKADLTDADLSGANCFEADFFETKWDRARWSGANVKGTLLTIL